MRVSPHLPSNTQRCATQGRTPLQRTGTDGYWLVVRKSAHSNVTLTVHPKVGGSLWSKRRTLNGQKNTVPYRTPPHTTTHKGATVYLNTSAHVRGDTPVYVSHTDERNGEDRYAVHLGTYPQEVVLFVGRADAERIAHTLTEALHGRDPNDDPEDAE